MAPFPLTEGDVALIVSYSRESGEEMSEAVVNAFDAAGVDIFDRPSTLSDWVESEMFETVEWSSDRPLSVCTRIWDHMVLLTPEEVRIYKSRALD